MYLSLILASLVALARAVPATDSTSCSRDIRSLSDVGAAAECTTVNIYSFTVPAGETFSLNLLDYTTVNVYGDIQFGNMTWNGPLFKVIGNNIKFNGNGYRWDGGGPFYWDGKGGGGGLTKPQIMMWIQMSGTLTNMEVINSPTHAFGIFNPGPLTVSGVKVDDSKISVLSIEARSNEATQVKVTIPTLVATVPLQGSISSNTVVSRVSITGNTVINSQQAFRIKSIASATGGRVSNVVFNGNTASSIKKYGVLITQSYPKALGTPGNGVTFSNIVFHGAPTTIATDSGAYMVAVNCGKGSCTGSWDWTGLQTHGGRKNLITNNNLISGF
ncbi:hypothetical protein ID866_8524 [Astraeus odoratus]|nr:hypothetical protein ID866_8524 [Astraeus odoratus]